MFLPAQLSAIAGVASLRITVRADKWLSVRVPAFRTSCRDKDVVGGRLRINACLVTIMTTAMKKSSANRNSRRRSKPSRVSVRGFAPSKNVFPLEMRGTVTYATVLALGPAAGAIVDQVFRLNSVYDPDYSGVGSTAFGYTQYAALYQRYRVLRATARIVWDNLATNPITAFVCATPNTVISTGINIIQGQRLSWVGGVGGVGGNSTREHTISAPIHIVFGCPARQVATEHDFASAVGANPSNSVYLHVGAYQNGASAGSFNLQVRIEYDVIFSMPYDIST